jgi:predicted HAD superfamily Cof-like phosphohydrolase
MKKQLNHVERFHDTFGIPNQYSPKSTIEKDLILLRHRLMNEENEEYLEAALNGDTVEVADALGDMLYILCGTILSHGMQEVIEEVFEEIQRSNMSKLGEDGKPIYREDGKVMKGQNYFRPDIASVLKS